MRSRILAITLLMAAAPAEAGGPPPSVFPATPRTRAAEPGRVVAAWGVAPQGREVVVNFDCSHFVPSDRGHAPADATVRVLRRWTTGPVTSGVLRAQAQTDLAHHQTQARVSATARGDGVAFFEVEVRVDGRHCPAGQYNTTIGAALAAP